MEKGIFKKVYSFSYISNAYKTILIEDLRKLYCYFNYIIFSCYVMLSLIQTKNLGINMERFNSGEPQTKKKKQ